ncbi:MAG: FAD-binding oxidoreductase [Hyphomicrobiaceae bacterium]
MTTSASQLKVENDLAVAAQERVRLAVEILRQRMGERVQTGVEIRRQHGHTLTSLPNQPPDAVVFARSTDEVCEIVSVAHKHNVPVIAFGGGTSLEGHVNAPNGGISLDLTGMSAIVEVYSSDMQAVVQAGVTREQLNIHLRDCGLFFAVDPGAETATIGGMAATRASGTNTVRYGTIRENVVNVTAVMANGDVVKTANRAAKSSAGYDLTHLLVGSEGTLGIITELTVKLHPRPEKIAAAVAPFKSLQGACDATIEARQLGLGLARIELMDSLLVKTVNAHAKLDLDEAPTLFLEFHGSTASVGEAVETFRELADAHGAVRYDWADRPEERSALWHARHETLWAVKSYWPGQETLVTDVCVPISNLAKCVVETQKDLEETGLIGPIVGHVGDGNFHVVLVHDPNDTDQRAKITGWLNRLTARAIAMDGTCTGEHGIGQGKTRFLQDELASAVPVMKSLKQALDPLGILNPGKIFKS